MTLVFIYSIYLTTNFVQSSRLVPSASALIIVGYIGSVLSILLLLATVIIYLRYK